jgi:hypothetical protein
MQVQKVFVVWIGFAVYVEFALNIVVLIGLASLPNFRHFISLRLI